MKKGGRPGGKNFSGPEAHVGQKGGYKLRKAKRGEERVGGGSRGEKKKKKMEKKKKKILRSFLNIVLDQVEGQNEGNPKGLSRCARSQRKVHRPKALNLEREGKFRELESKKKKGEGSVMGGTRIIQGKRGKI